MLYKIKCTWKSTKSNWAELFHSAFEEKQVNNHPNPKGKHKKPPNEDQKVTGTWKKRTPTLRSQFQTNRAVSTDLKSKTNENEPEAMCLPSSHHHLPAELEDPTNRCQTQSAKTATDLNQQKCYRNHLPEQTSKMPREVSQRTVKSPKFLKSRPRVWRTVYTLEIRSTIPWTG
jgi:hypothetical protein